MQQTYPRFEDVAPFVLSCARPTINNGYSDTCLNLSCLRCCRTDILAPLWVRIRHSQQMLRYQQLTRACSTTRDEFFWEIANHATWRKERRAWTVLFPDEPHLPLTRPTQPFIWRTQAKCLDRNEPRTKVRRDRRKSPPPNRDTSNALRPRLRYD